MNATHFFWSREKFMLMPPLGENTIIIQILTKILSVILKIFAFLRDKEIWRRSLVLLQLLFIINPRMSSEIYFWFGLRIIRNNLIDFFFDFIDLIFRDQVTVFYDIFLFLQFVLNGLNL